MAHAKEVFKSLKGLFPSCLMRGLLIKAEQYRGMSLRDSEEPWGQQGTSPRPEQLKAEQLRKHGERVICRKEL